MIKLLINTFATKVITAAVTLAIVMLTTHFLGASGRGQVSLFTADIGIVLLFLQIVGGSSLVYLVPRSNTFHLLICAVIWSAVLPFILIPIMHLTGIVQHGFTSYLILITIMQGLSSTCQIILLGHEKINSYNILMFVQTFIQCAGLSFLFFIIGKLDTESFVWSLILCHLITLAMGLILTKKLITAYSLLNFWKTAKTAVNSGFAVQFSNLIQFLNYRLSFFFLSSQLTNLGLFSISLVLAEAIWLFGNSISLVQYSKISNEKSREDSVQISFNLAKLGFWATLTCVFILMLAPENIYTYVFGLGFSGARIPTLVLCPGILAIGLGMSFSHHFAGIGKFKVNNIAALIGLAVNVPCCLLFVEEYKEIGAAAACSLSYIASCIYLFMRFRKETGFSLKGLMITKQDLILIRSILFRHTPI